MYGGLFLPQDEKKKNLIATLFSSSFEFISYNSDFFSQNYKFILSFYLAKQYARNNVQNVQYELRIVWYSLAILRGKIIIMKYKFKLQNILFFSQFWEIWLFLQFQFVKFRISQFWTKILIYLRIPSLHFAIQTSFSEIAR